MKRLFNYNANISSSRVTKVCLKILIRNEKYTFRYYFSGIHPCFDKIVILFENMVGAVEVQTESVLISAPDPTHVAVGPPFAIVYFWYWTYSYTRNFFPLQPSQFGLVFLTLVVIQQIEPSFAVDLTNFTCKNSIWKRYWGFPPLYSRTRWASTWSLTWRCAWRRIWIR